MEVLLLGPLEVRDRGRSLSVPGNRPRALLALLALNAGRVMPADRLVELLWGEEAPLSAANALQVHISNLRKVLEPDGPPYRVLVSDRSGYVLNLTPDQVDLARFERLVEQGHQAITRGDVVLCARLLDEASAIWRGSALTGLLDHPWSFGEARRLEELRLAAVEDRVEADLALGRHHDLVAQLEALIARHPLRERFRAQLMIALYRCGRQAEASDVYLKTRELLVEELGMEPGYELQRLLRAILNQDPSLQDQAPERPLPRVDNLPAPLTSFVGRKREVAEVAAALLRSRMVTLTGTGGIGKTRLAIEVARGLLGSYARGIWLASLASISDPNLVPERVSAVLAVRGRAGQTTTQSLIARLREGRCLIVLDTCEHLVDACAQLAEALLTSCPGVTVLATSREALGVDGELVWQVPPMELPEPGLLDQVAAASDYAAVDLFRQRALSAVGSLELDGPTLQLVVRLCRHLDGIPLAIELAAARLKVISLDELSTRIGDRFRVLTSDKRTASPRHQTLRRAIDWSYDLLSEADRSLLRKLSVFAGSFTLEAAEAIGGHRDGEDLVDVLSSLIRKSMVLIERNELEVRYRLIDTIREYADGKLREIDVLGAADQRHSRFFRELAERGAPHLRGPNAAVWMGRLAADHDNMRAALRSRFQAGDSEELGRLLGALWWFWYVRCFFEEGRRWLDVGLTQLQPTSRSSRVSLLLGAGQLAWAQGDHGSDRALFEEALSLAADLGDDGLVGQSLLRLSLADYATGQMNAAAVHLEESIRRLRQHGPPSMLAEALNNLGWIRAFELDDLASSAELLSESLTVARQCGDQWALLEVLDSVAHLRMAESDIDAAQASQEESLRICIAIGDSWSAPRVLAGFVQIAIERGQPDRALCLAAAAARLRDDVGMVLMPAEQAQLDPLIDKARASLDRNAATDAWKEGSRMTMMEAVQFALSPEIAKVAGKRA